MGAHFNCTDFPASSEAILKEKFNLYQDDMRYEHGNDPYSGHLGRSQGLRICSNTFKDNNEAETWIADNSDKWGAALAVKVGDFTHMFPKSSTDKKLFESVEAMQKSVDNWDKDILARVKAAKSQQRACSHCDSKISVKFLKSVACPVCSSAKFLETETDKQKFKALSTKLNESKTKLELARREHAKKAKPAHWLVGGWCAS